MDSSATSAGAPDRPAAVPSDWVFTQTLLGEWRVCRYPDGRKFQEYRSFAAIGPLPLMHFTSGLHPATGRHVTAKGVVAIGRFACGVLAIGQVAWGVVAVGQLALGLLFGFGQAVTGVVAVGQAALGLYFGLGQVATGETAIGQFAYGHWVLAQIGIGEHVYDTFQADQEVWKRLNELFR
jgi:hypothetical protein